jgi:hypothetical protein
MAQEKKRNKNSAGNKHVQPKGKPVLTRPWEAFLPQCILHSTSIQKEKRGSSKREPLK